MLSSFRPDALARLNAWGAQHAELVADIPDGAVMVEVGRHVSGGSYAIVRVADEHANRFRQAIEEQPSDR